jgi:hypothetical protein
MTRVTAFIEEPGDRQVEVIETTLYDLVEAVYEELSPGEETMVVGIVYHLLKSGRVQFIAAQASNFCLDNVSRELPISSRGTDRRRRAT